MDSKKKNDFLKVSDFPDCWLKINMDQVTKSDTGVL